MKFAIIGAGNIGSALAFGLAQSKLVRTEDICISNTHPEKLERIKAFDPAIREDPFRHRPGPAGGNVAHFLHHIINGSLSLYYAVLFGF